MVSISMYLILSLILGKVVNKVYWSCVPYIQFIFTLIILYASILAINSLYILFNIELLINNLTKISNRKLHILTYKLRTLWYTYSYMILNKDNKISIFFFVILSVKVFANNILDIQFRILRTFAKGDHSSWNNIYI